MNPRSMLSTTSVALSAVSSLLAAAPDYRYLQGGFVSVDPDGPVLDSGDGWSVVGSWGGKHQHFFGGLSEIDFDLDFGVPDVSAESNVDSKRRGLGWHGLLGERADIVIEGSFVDVETRQTITAVPLGPTGLRSSDEGIVVNGGVRFMATPQVEIHGFVRRSDFDDAADAESIRAGVIGFLGRLGIGLSVSTSDDSDQLDLFLRYGFGRRR